MSSDQRNPLHLDPFGEHATVDTPEQIQLQFPLAGIGSRFLAMALDTLIQAGIAIVMLMAALIIGVAGIANKLDTASLWILATLIILGFLLYYGYFAVFEILWNGQTPGKRKIGIRVIKDSGRPLTATETIARNLLRIVDQLPALYAVGVISALISKEGKRIGDYVAGSIVVHERSSEELGQTWRPAPARTSVAGRLGGERLTTDEIALIEAFLVRRYQLDNDVRYRMGGEILRRVEPKLTLTDDDRAGLERTLEVLVYEHRG